MHRTSRSLVPARSDRLDGHLGAAQIRRPIATTNPDAANALAVDQHRYAALEGRPSLQSGSERKADSMAHVEFLTGCSLRCGWASIRCGAHGLGSARVHCMEATAVHALEQNYVPTGIHDRAGDRDPSLAGHV